MSVPNNFNSEVILPLTTWGVPSGNYDGSSLDFFTDGTKAVGYYRGYGFIQTIFVSVTGFVGTIDFSATLNDIDEDAAWFSIGTTFGDSANSTTGIFPITVVGNFAWLRAEVKNFSAGTIDGVNVSY